MFDNQNDILVGLNNDVGIGLVPINNDNELCFSGDSFIIKGDNGKIMEFTSGKVKVFGELEIVKSNEEDSLDIINDIIRDLKKIVNGVSL